MALHANEEADVDLSKDDDNLETSPLAFTVHLDDPKPQSRKLKIHDKLSTFALKHRRNPSLPDFKAVNSTRSIETAESESPPSVLNNASKVSRHFMLAKPGYHSEGYFSSDQDEDSIKLKGRQFNIPHTKISPVFEVKDFTPQVNGASLPSRAKQLGNMRRNSLNDMDLNRMLRPMPHASLTATNSNYEVQQGSEDCDKSDTVSEAGTYTVDKDDSNEGASDGEIDLNKTLVIKEDANTRPTSDSKAFIPENHKWINDWVKKVAEENFLHPPNEPAPPQQTPSGSGRNSPSASQIPSPIMPKINDTAHSRRSDRSLLPKVNGVHHKRSSSLSAKDFSDNRTSDSSLETESYLRATESVVTAMQNRMKNSLQLNLSGDIGKKNANRKEKIHPPSTASDTDTNSENEAKSFKKPVTAPFSSARLNKAFSLRRARADLEAEAIERGVQKKKVVSPVVAASEKRSTPVRATPILQNAKTKSPAPTTPFSRTDCGRFSMRATPTTFKSPSAVSKKDVRKPSAGGRSNSSLSSKEVEFQNWKRRKSFDPMKAAAEGRKKEAAKKAAMTQSLTHSNLSPSASMTQSVNLGNSGHTPSGNLVLRSASFHVSPLQQSESLDYDDYNSPEDDDELESAESSCFSRQPTLPPNSPTPTLPKTTLLQQRGVSGSRGSISSIVSESHSSPSRRVRSDLIDNLLISTISDLSHKLKFKSNNLLQKLDSYCDGDDRIARLREEMASDSKRGSANSSPSRKVIARDFPAIVKNLKTVENILQTLDDVIFGDERLNDD